MVLNQENGHCSKNSAPWILLCQAREVYSVTQCVLLAFGENKQVKGKILAKMVCASSTLNTLLVDTASWNRWGNMIRKKRGQREGAQVQWKYQPAPPRSTMRTNRKNQSYWNPFPLIHDFTEVQTAVGDLDYERVFLKLKWWVLPKKNLYFSLPSLI